MTRGQWTGQSQRAEEGRPAGEPGAVGAEGDGDHAQAVLLQLVLHRDRALAVPPHPGGWR